MNHAKLHPAYRHFYFASMLRVCPRNSILFPTNTIPTPLAPVFVLGKGGNPVKRHHRPQHLNIPTPESSRATSRTRMESSACISRYRGERRRTRRRPRNSHPWHPNTRASATTQTCRPHTQKFYNTTGWAEGNYTAPNKELDKKQ